MTMTYTREITLTVTTDHPAGMAYLTGDDDAKLREIAHAAVYAAIKPTADAPVIIRIDADMTSIPGADR